MEKNRILVLSPHADDAELGCGGSMQRFIEEKAQLHLAIFSVCEDSLLRGMPEDTLENEAKAAAKQMKLSKGKVIIFKNKVRSFPAIRQSILDSLIDLRKEINPSIVVMPSLNDYHQDHQVLANEAIRAFKMKASIISYELPWNHINFQTQLFVKLEKRHVESKYKVLQNYKSQLKLGRNYFTKDFIVGLANVRGTQCNAAYAEAFEVVKWMI